MGTTDTPGAIPDEAVERAESAAAGGPVEVVGAAGTDPAELAHAESAALAGELFAPGGEHEVGDVERGAPFGTGLLGHR